MFEKDDEGGYSLRTERIGKYNRLLEIEMELGRKAHLGRLDVSMEADPGKKLLMADETFAH